MQAENFENFASIKWHRRNFVTMFSSETSNKLLAIIKLFRTINKLLLGCMNYELIFSKAQLAAGEKF